MVHARSAISVGHGRAFCFGSGRALGLPADGVTQYNAPMHPMLLRELRLCCSYRPIDLIGQCPMMSCQLGE